MSAIRTTITTTAAATVIVGLAAATASAGVVETITLWDFNGPDNQSVPGGALSPTPILGSGTASLLGGTTATFAAGAGGGGAPNFGWNTSSYQAQGEGSGESGVQFLVGTTGWQDIVINFDHRASGTASRWAQVDYTLDGGATWVVGFWNNGGGLSPHDTFFNFTVDFSSVAGANDNADFGVRIVSIFSPVAFEDGLGNAFGANEAYHRARIDGGSVYGPGGTWRFDNVSFRGTLIPGPGAIALLGLAGLVGRRRRNG